MIKNNVSVKTKMDEKDVIAFTKDYADGFFSEDEFGNVSYTPYMKDLQFKLLFYLYCVDGLTFESVTDEAGKEVMEGALGAIEDDKEVNDLFTGYLKGIYKGRPLSYQLGRIKKDALDMVEFRKQVIIHSKKDALSDLLNVFSEKISSIDLSNFNPEAISDYIVKSYLASDMFSANQAEIKNSKKVSNPTEEKAYES